MITAVGGLLGIALSYVVSFSVGRLTLYSALAKHAEAGDITLVVAPDILALLEESPSELWRQADKLAGSGQYRDAVRVLYLAVLALFAVWLLERATGKLGRFITTPLNLPVLAFLTLLIAKPPRLPPDALHPWRGLSVREELKYAGAGLCGVTLYMLFQNTALSFTMASNVSVPISTTTLFTALAARFFLKEEALKPNFFIGFAVAIAGIILIAFNGNFFLKLNPLGDLLAILAAVALGGGVILATAATVIASQAVITGAYSLTQQAIQLGLLPRLETRHTSEALFGQIFMPVASYSMLMKEALHLIARKVREAERAIPDVRFRGGEDRMMPSTDLSLKLVLAPGAVAMLRRRPDAS